MLRRVERDDQAHWDRAAELEGIKATYAGYARDGRARLWDLHERGFARLTNELGRGVQRELVAAISGRNGLTVVDLGCGTGELVSAAPEGVERWIGVDLRPEAVEVARARFPKATFITASADEVPLEDGTADIVVARLLFSSLPSRRLESAVAREIGRLLDPRGTLVWLDIRYSNPTNPAVHGLSRASAAALFPAWRHVLRSVGLLPPIARRLGLLTPVLYPALSAVAPLRSHLVGRLLPPAGAEA